MIQSLKNNTSQEPSTINREQAIQILYGKTDIMDTVHQAYQQRKKYFLDTVQIHILDNIKNGYCPEDCRYCAQRKDGESGIQEYSLKSIDTIYQDAIEAKENGAYRFCMVTSGTEPTDNFIQKIAPLIQKIHSELDLKVCLSAGILDEERAKLLKNAGLDRYNHNLNTSETYYSQICTTHDYSDRVQTLNLLKKNDIAVCSGIIIGMGESIEDIVDVAFALKLQSVISIPVNFFIPITGHEVEKPSILTPEFCIRVLSMFRLVNPDSEVRIGAGREGYLKGMQTMALYVANSLFASGYLNVKGSDMNETIQLIYDAGFTPELHDGTAFEKSKQTETIYSNGKVNELYKFRKSKS